MMNETHLLQKRQFYGKGAALSLGLSQKEDAAGFPSAVAMIRIRQGLLKDPEWERMYREYLALIRTERRVKSSQNRMEMEPVSVDEKAVEMKRTAARKVAEFDG